MTDETTHIATAAAMLADPYAALSQHLHGDGDACAAEGCGNQSAVTFADGYSVRHLCRECANAALKETHHDR